MSYEYLTQISTEVATRVSEQYFCNAIVPGMRRKSVFTTADVDSINEIVRSMFRLYDLNCTMLSFTNHLTSDNEGLKRELKYNQLDPESQPEQKKIALPDSNSIALPIELRNVDIYLTQSNERCFPESTYVTDALVTDRGFCETHVCDG